jgi:hypothetical protein
VCFNVQTHISGGGQNDINYSSVEETLKHTLSVNVSRHTREVVFTGQFLETFLTFSSSAS